MCGATTLCPRTGIHSDVCVLVKGHTGPHESPGTHPCRWPNDSEPRKDV